MSSTNNPPPASHSIAMWGAAGSGKTTFLTALRIAQDRRRHGWTIVGADKPSAAFLTNATRRLNEDHRFYPATGALYRYSWHLLQRGAAGRRRWLPWPHRRADASARVALEFLDPPGGVYQGGFQGLRDTMVEDLTACRGIIFLFDPTREKTHGDTYDCLQDMLGIMNQRMMSNGEFQDGMLPHHLAVCVTKFDELWVWEKADKLGLVTYEEDDPFGFPRVEGDEAAEFFRELCDMSPTGNAEMVPNALEGNFHPDRIKYFVTSSIGFNLDSTSKVFDPDDPQNVRPVSADERLDDEPQDALRIRSQVHPINVMEPMTWLAERLGGQP